MDYCFFQTLLSWKRPHFPAAESCTAACDADPASSRVDLVVGMFLLSVAILES